MVEQPAKPAVSLSITLPDSDRQLRYIVQRESDRLEIKPDFEYWHEELGYVLWKLSTEKKLARQAKERPLLTFPRRLDRRKEFLDLERDENRARFGREPEAYKPLVESIRKERRALVNRIIREECQPLADLPPKDRQVLSGLGPEGRRAFAVFLFELIEELAPREGYKLGEPFPTLHWPDEVEAVVFAAINIFDDDLFLVPERPHPAFLAQLAHSISQVIWDWKQRARDGGGSERSRALRNLHRISPVFVPPTKGLREKRIKVPDLEVKTDFYRELFRCEQAAALLKKAAGRSQGKLTLEAVCKALSLSDNPRWWGFSNKGQVLRQLLDAKLSAFFITARRFDVTEQTVRNAVSR